MKRILAVTAAVLAALAAVFLLTFETVGDHYKETDTVISDASVTISVSCAELCGNGDVGKALRDSGLVPDDGVIIPETQYPISEGDTVFDVLRAVLKDNRIHFDYTDISDRSAYVKGINNIYEYDCGDLSGWMYSVNGIFPTVASSEYTLSDGDVILWQYTCDLGRDVGDTYYTLHGSDAA